MTLSSELLQYGLSGELLSLNSETRTYNSRLQLTRIIGGVNMEYRYSPTQNNGQITQQKDWNTGANGDFFMPRSSPSKTAGRNRS